MHYQIGQNSGQTGCIWQHYKLELSPTLRIQVKSVGIDWFDLDSESKACSGDSLYENPSSAIHFHDTRNMGTREGDFSAVRTRIAPPSKIGKPYYANSAEIRLR